MSGNPTSIYLFEAPSRTERWRTLLASSALDLHQVDDAGDLLQLLKTARGKLLLTSAARFERFAASWRGAVGPVSVVVVLKSGAEQRVAELLTAGATVVLTEDELSAARLIEMLAARLQELRGAISVQRAPGGPGFVTLDDEGRVQQINPSAAELIGVPPEQVIGRSWREIARGDGSGLSSTAAGRTFHEHRVPGYRGRLLRISPPGDQLAALGQAFPQLTRLNRLALSGRLVATVLHDLRTPTAYVRANMDALLETLARLERAAPGSAEWQELLAEIRELAADSGSGAAHLAEIARLLELGTGQTTDDAPLAAADGVAELAVQMLRKEIDYRAQLELDLQRVPLANIPHDRLLQVLVNVLRNAVDAIEPGDAKGNNIVVRTMTVDRMVVVEVQDSGAGIPDAMRGRLGEPFATGKPAGQGTGLGLYLCQKFVREAGGRMCFHDAHPRGTHVRIELPVAAGKSAQAGSGRNETPEARTPARPQRPARILVVDDDRLTRTAFSRLLQTVHRVDQADSVDMALNLLAEQVVDVIICDLMMPGRSGVELWEELAAMNRPAAERIVFVTAGIYDPIVRAMVARSGRPLLIKPVSESQLFRAIDDVLTGGLVDG
ncbi:MAG: response regulator [Candidatus Dadabacteria bacterium]|nr:MAG: response regulator [Candidatus Dadabacteria bacterium]